MTVDRRTKHRGPRGPRTSTAEAVDRALRNAAAALPIGREQLRTERARELRDDNALEVAHVADMMSDLKRVRALWKAGDGDGAFEALVFFVEGFARKHPKLEAYIDSSIVDDEGNIDERGKARREAEKLFREGLGPRPPRADELEAKP